MENIGCLHTFTRGPRKGERCCASVISGTGKCRSHIGYLPLPNVVVAEEAKKTKQEGMIWSDFITFLHEKYYRNLSRRGTETIVRAIFNIEEEEERRFLERDYLLAIKRN